MRITIESTLREFPLHGKRARVWEGVTESGWPVVALIVRMAVTDDYPEPEGIPVMHCIEPSDYAREAFPDLPPYDRDAWRKRLEQRIRNGDAD
jgi:hypothetical protein